MFGLMFSLRFPPPTEKTKIMSSFAVEGFSVTRFLKLKNKEIKARYDKFKKLIPA